MENTNAKFIKLIHSSVKIPGGGGTTRRNVRTINQGTSNFLEKLVFW